MNDGNWYTQKLLFIKLAKKALKNAGVKFDKKNVDKLKPNEVIEYYEYLYELVQDWEDQNQKELEIY